MSETESEKLNRVRLMADGDPTWDLSPNDLDALKHVVDELDRLRAIVDEDARRMSWLAGCGGDDGPVIEGFAMILDDFWYFLGDAIRERIGEENDSPDIEGTDDDKLAAFRAMVDEAMSTEKARNPC